MHRLLALLALTLGQVETPPPPEPERPAPEPAPAAAAPGEPAAEPSEPPPSRGEPGPAAASPAVEEPPARPKPRRQRAAPVAPALARPPGPTPSERERVARLALRFFDALLGRRAAELSSLCASTFSFDGRAVTGQPEIRARFGDLFAQRDGVAYALLDLAVMPSAEALARYGKPPPRVASLAQASAWVAVANLSGRATFVFFERQGNGWLATGMHD